ncbi:PREDICTED: uncharacterized protein LOC106114516 [Papilio xuthus]|uniref:Uncharacterized protein LOC106114516 n=1 Tax=Papilio xuthus TaxID=66420 RepID=A0AAJ6Z1L6_PAPXU|nr:PREDICTED: uncharacterized protein LOC106114516 [Papilio xuthus]
MSDAEQQVRDLVQKIAEEQGYEDCHIELKSFTTGGANYTSQLFHITITSPDKDDLKLFAKIACVGEKIRKLTPFKMFETEMYFYTELLKHYQDLEEKHNVPKEHRLATVKFYGCNKEYLNETLVLEDLSSLGFDIHDRFKSFDWEYASTSIVELAKLHALSIAFRKQKPEEYEILAKLLTFDINSEDFKPMMEHMTRSALAVVKEENRWRLVTYLEKMKDLESSHYYRPLNCAVVTHGDFRPSNLMHRVHEDGRLELVPVDYQMMKVCNPALDLMYYIFGGSDEEFRDKHYHQLLDYYYEQLSNALVRLDVDAVKTYPREAFDSDIKEIEPYGIFVGMMMVPLLTVDAENAPSMDTADLSDFVIKPNELAISRLNGIIHSFIKLGVL